MTDDIYITLVTLDTNIPQELWMNQEKVVVVEELLALADDGHLDLAITTRIDYDIPRPPLSNRIRELAGMGVKTIGAPFAWGISSWDSGDFWVTEEEIELVDEIKSILTARRMRLPEDTDFDHILGHRANERDVFLTWDKPILRAADLFRDKLGVRIVKPEDFIDQLGRS